MSDDAATELLIAQLLEQDMQLLASTQAAEELQYRQVVDASARAAGHGPTETSAYPKADYLDSDFALAVMASETQAARDAAFAQRVQQTDNSAITANHQYAQTVAAAENKSTVDAEFARRLQAMDSAGERDIDSINDAETLLGAGEVERLIALNPNNKGKGKGKREVAPSPSGDSLSRQWKIKREDEPARWGVKPEPIYNVSMLADVPICGICLEPYHPTYSPLAASLSANSSGKIPFGMRLPCPSSHGFCIGCMNTYIGSKLQLGDEEPGRIIFPIRCPGCSSKEWVDGIPDDIADRLLGEKGMVAWHHQKLADSIPKFYCPNPRCSELVQVHEDKTEPQAVCPSCSTLICVPCEVVFHKSMTCEQFQAVPLDERSPEDQLVLTLAQAENWRRCPKCKVIVELTHGCNHITCRCGGEFCFKCGGDWVGGKCVAVPACALWDEDRLVVQQQQQQQQRQQYAPQPPRNIPVQRPQQPQYNAYVPPPPAYQPHVPDLSWIDDARVVCARHPFTTNMIQTLTCGYCQTPLNSLNDLRYHLQHVTRHPVYACCGRFFRRAVDFERHVDSKYGHSDQVRRDG